MTWGNAGKPCPCVRVLSSFQLLLVTMRYVSEQSLEILLQQKMHYNSTSSSVREHSIMCCCSACQLRLYLFTIYIDGNQTKWEESHLLGLHWTFNKTGARIHSYSGHDHKCTKQCSPMDQTRPLCCLTGDTPHSRHLPALNRTRLILSLIDAVRYFSKPHAKKAPQVFYGAILFSLPLISKEQTPLFSKSPDMCALHHVLLWAFTADSYISSSSA